MNHEGSTSRDGGATEGVGTRSTSSALVTPDLVWSSAAPTGACCKYHSSPSACERREAAAATTTAADSTSSGTAPPRRRNPPLPPPLKDDGLMPAWEVTGVVAALRKRVVGDVKRKLSDGEVLDRPRR